MTKDEIWKEFLKGIEEGGIKQSLFDMLEQVAKEQREICLKNASISISSDGKESIVDLNETSILNAPSPLSHE